MKKQFKYLIFFQLIIALKVNLCVAQITINEIETYLFYQVFNSENRIKEFIELNAKSDTTRYWQFNESGKLIKEIDYRRNSKSCYISRQTTNQSIPSKREFCYNYQPSKQINNIKEIENTEGKTSTILNVFTSLNKDTIIEFYKINLNEFSKVDIEITKTLNEAKLQEILQVMKNYIGESYFVTKQRIEYKYDLEKKLNQTNHYFTINRYSENEEPAIIHEELGAKTYYTYDKYRRLNKIFEVELTEEGTQKLRNEVNFYYKDKSNKIKRINVIYGENFCPNLVEYKIQYKLNGELKRIKINENCFNYITK